MPHAVRVAFVAALCLAFLPPQGFAEASEFSERLRHRLEIAQASGNLVAGHHSLHLTDPLQARYEQRGFRPAWFDDNQRPLPALFGLLEAIGEARHEGLDAEDYHYGPLAEHLARWQPGRSPGVEARILTDVELLASDAFLSLAAHYRDGRVDPLNVDPKWHLERSRTEELPSLDQVGASREAPAQLLQAQLPRYPAYAALRERLALQRRLAEEAEWPDIAQGPLLRPDMEDPRVPAIRERLYTLGDLEAASEPEPATRYDPPLQAAVRRFQERHGLEPDAVVGPQTLQALNVSPEARIASLRANMERWRWLPPELGEEYILVNIAGYYMQVVQNSETIMRQRVIVGRPYRQTPVFTGNMTYLVLNPSWEVPHSLAVQDQLPLIRQDLDYLERMGFSVLRGWGAAEQRIDPQEVDWDRLGPRNFPYRLRQRPGPQNALGTVKFMFPNQHNVYLHDTPARGLFAQAGRAFSSGCIRIEDPLALTDWLLHGPGRPSVMSRERIRQTLDQRGETTVRLGRALPVHLLYWTAWIDEDGQVQYRRDIYERDERLLQALDRPSPSRIHLEDSL